MAAATPKSTAVVVIGMAGSGKTTFMRQLTSYLHSQRNPPYVINLDPAVRSVPFDSNIDIRDSIDYKEVMTQYNLGPNGGILTSLNLFATKVDQVLAILEKRCGITPPTGVKPTSSTSKEAPSPTTSTTANDASTSASATKSPSEKPTSPSKIPAHILIDTPGQIEVFVWSASGSIILSALASSFPTVLAYVIDTPRTASTATFMANMLYACSILYKTRLPMVLVFNKTDVKDAAFAKEWMTDFEAFQAALRREEEGGGAGGGGPDGPAVAGGVAGCEEGGIGYGVGTAGVGSGYMNSLLSSMSLVLEEFYAHLQVVGVSSATGQGMGDFIAAVQEKAAEFEREYVPELERRREDVRQDVARRREKEMDRLMSDLDVAGGKKTRAPAKRRKPEPETISDLEDEEEEEDGDYGMVEPDDDEEDEDAEDDAIEQRYRQATRYDKVDGGADDEFLSFERYIRKTQQGGG